MAHPRPLFNLFSFFSNNLQNKTVDFSRIRTRIVGIESKHADHGPLHLFLLNPPLTSVLGVIMLGNFQPVFLYFRLYNSLNVGQILSIRTRVLYFKVQRKTESPTESMQRNGIYFRMFIFPAPSIHSFVRSRY